jgi:hypothetical protein
MTGYEHFLEAEKLLAQVEEMFNDTTRAEAIGQAQVHATLALAAATWHAPEIFRKGYGR